MAAVIYFKDGTQSIVIPGGANARIDVPGDLFEVVDAGTPVPAASVLAIAPLTNVEYVVFS